MFNLIHSTYYICSALLAILILGVCFNFRDTAGMFKKMARKDWLFLLIIFIVGLLVRLYVVPHRHYVFYDEYEHINIAKNMAETKQFSYCNFYLDGKCLSSSLPQWTPGYYFLLSLFFGLFGVSEVGAYTFNVFLGAFSVVLLFLVTYLITQKNSVSFIAALMLTFCPLHLKFSGNSSLEMVSFFFILFSLLGLFVFLKSPTNKSSFQYMAILAYTLLVRQDNGLLLLLFTMLLIMERVQWKVLLKSTFFLFLFAPYCLYLPWIKQYQITYWLATRSHLSYLRLFTGNLLFWAANSAVPLIYTFMAVVGAYCGIRKKEKKYFWMCLYFFIFLLAYSSPYSQRSLSGGDTQRFNLQLYFPVIILGAVGMYEIYRSLKKYLKKSWVVFAILLFPTTLNIIYNFSYISAEITLPIHQKQYELFLKGKEIDNGCVFIAYNPASIITTIERSSVHISFMFNDKVYQSYLKDRCLVLVDDYWCSQDPGGFCKLLKDKFTLEPYESDSGKDLSLFYRMQKSTTPQ